jgi:hypothetical protein
VSTNQRGDIAFAASASIGGKADTGTFLWDYQSQKVTLLAFKGLPAVRNLTFQSGGDFSRRSTTRVRSPLRLP